MNSKKPTYSIIIPTLNEEVFLPRILDDLKQQTFTDFEVLVVDGHSEDKTNEIVTSEKDLDIQLILSDVRHVSHQRNLGGKQAQSDWLIFFDADTRISPTFLHELKHALSTKDCDAFTCFTEPDSTDLSDKAICRACNLGLLASKQLKKPNAWGCCMGSKKEVFETLGGFSTEVDFQEDGEFVRRLTDEGYKFRVLEHPTFIMSFRRFKKEGRLNVIRKASILHLKNTFQGFDSSLAKKLYPMKGGSDYIPAESEDARLMSQLTKKQLQKIQGFLKKFFN